MAVDVPKAALETISKVLSGATPSKARADYWGGGIPWVSAKDMKKHRLSDAEDHITSAGLENGSKLAPANATLILTRGMTLLNDVPICRLACDVAFNQDVKAIVPRPQIDPTYLTYALLASKSELLSMVELAGHGTGRLPTDLLKALDIPLPSKGEQRAIAHILETLDDKIELNQRMNETLGGIAKVIFRSWFVDFDPVRVKAENRDTGFPNHIAALFPDSFVDSELGDIPVGWNAGKVGDFFKLSRESLNPGLFQDEVFYHYSIPAFDESRMPKQEKGETIKSNKFIVLRDCVLLSKLNPRIPRVWLPNLFDLYRAVCTTEFLVAQPKSCCSREFLFGLFSSETFTSVFATLTTGTSGSHQRVKPESLLELDWVVPSEPVIERFTSLTIPLLKRISENLQESKTLTALRDTLLPKLISGELRVKDADRLVEEVA
jgi:type I restriction enzyme, S subunit